MLSRDVLSKKPTFSVLQALWDMKFIHAPNRSRGRKSLAVDG